MSRCDQMNLQYEKGIMKKKTRNVMRGNTQAKKYERWTSFSRNADTPPKSACALAGKAVSSARLS